MGIIGQKRGMTRVFKEDGSSVAVTIVECKKNIVTQVKSIEKDGYCAVQVGYGNKKQVNKPSLGHVKNLQQKKFELFKEFSCQESNPAAVGDQIDINSFEIGQKVDVTGYSKGKGFAGVIKRYHFKSQDKTHGNSLSHRAPGSIGQNQSPGKVFKGKKMAGHLGNTKCTIQNLVIHGLDKERELIIIEGAIPGSNNSYVTLKPAIKS